jgi:hypothetical protein
MAIAPLQVGRVILSFLGAVAGGVVGYYTFQWLISQNFYGLMIPGALVGLGSGLLSDRPSHVRGVLCALAGLFLGLYAEWSFEPFRDDRSFLYLLSHVHQFRPVTMLMLALGTFFAYWLGRDGGFRLLPSNPAPSKPVNDHESRSSE